jgi:hypothetical protein
MLKRVRPHLTYANVMVTVLGFVVLTGGLAMATVNGSGDVQFGGQKGFSGTFDTIVTAPGVGKIQANCNKAAFIRFKNTSGTGLDYRRFEESSGEFAKGSLGTGDTVGEVPPNVDVSYEFHVFHEGNSNAGPPMADFTVSAEDVTTACDNVSVVGQVVSKD